MTRTLALAACLLALFCTAPSAASSSLADAWRNGLRQQEVETRSWARHCRVMRAYLGFDVYGCRWR